MLKGHIHTLDILWSTLEFGAVWNQQANPACTHFIAVTVGYVIPRQEAVFEDCFLHISRDFLSRKEGEFAKKDTAC